MAEDNDQPKVNYSSNSKAQKDAEKQEAERPRLERIASDGVIEKKPSLGSKFRETFAGDDARSVGHYLLFDVIVPATKNLIFDMLSQGAQRMLFGSSATPPRSSSLINGGKTSYSAIYKAAENKPREISPQSRSVFEFREIIFSNRGEAEKIIDALSELVDTYGTATVADFYAAAGVSSEWTDGKWGWDNLGSAGVRHVRDGYLLEMPRPKPLN